MDRRVVVIDPPRDAEWAFDDGYRASVLPFVTALHPAGELRLRTFGLPCFERPGELLVEGGCRIYLAAGRTGLRESCGHPGNFNELNDMRSTVHPSDRVTVRGSSVHGVGKRWLETQYGVTA